MLTMSRKSLVAVSLAAVLAMTVAGAAFAGTNGQQVKVYESSNIGSLCMAGYNQSGSYANYWFEAPASIFHTNSYGGYWWRTYNGTPVFLDYYSGSGQLNYLGSNSCSVPEYQPGDDWWQCNSV